MRYEVVRANGEPEGLIATDWDILPSGALVFYSVEGSFKTFEIAYAPGAWTCFFGADE